MKIDESSSGIRFRVRVQPRASKTELAGVYGEALKVRLAAPPVDGEANDELVRFLAKKLDVSRSAVAIVAGESGRDKLIEVTGVRVADAREALGGG